MGMIICKCGDECSPCTLDYKIIAYEFQSFSFTVWLECYALKNFLLK